MEPFRTLLIAVVLFHLTWTVAAQQCPMSVDLLFMIDSSRSVGRTEFRKELQFAATITDSFIIGPTDAQIGLQSFSTEPRNVFFLKDFTTADQVKLAILNAPYRKGTTNTDLALKNARRRSFAASNGAREGTPKLVVLLTDRGSRSESRTLKQAQLLKDSGVYMISVGIGKRLNFKELEAMASNDELMFTVDDFHGLAMIQTKLSEAACRVLRCQIPIDLLFMLESSRSVKETGFQKELQFAASVSESFNIGPTQTQVGLQLFGTFPRNQFFLNTYTTAVQVKDATLNAPYKTGQAFTHRALKNARRRSLQASKGARKQALKVAVVLTDGTSRSESLTLRQARRLKDSGVKMISVGIGTDLNNKELKAMASSDELAYDVDDFDDLASLQKSLSKAACQVPDISQPCVDSCASNLLCQQMNSNVKRCVCPEKFEYDTHTKTCIKVEPCQIPIDLLFMVDSSRSVGRKGFQKELQFAAKISESFNIGPDVTHVGLQVFSTEPKNVFFMNKYTTGAQVHDAILDVPYRSGKSNTFLALKNARKRSFKPSNGARQGARKLVVLLTGGKSRSESLTRRQAKFLKNSGVKMISIGIGKKLNNKELKAMASSDELAYDVEKFDDLVSLQIGVSRAACNVFRCQVPTDLLFIVDSSRSVRKRGFQKELQFAAKVSETFHIGPANTLVGLQAFGTEPKNVFFLRDYTTGSQVKEAILNAPYKKGKSYTDLALKNARLRSLKATFGARDGVRKLVVLLTDGRSRSASLTRRQANLLKKSGVKVISVGIGKRLNTKELKAMASFNELVFRVDNFDQLATIQGSLSQAGCKVPDISEHCVDRCLSNLVCQRVDEDAKRCICADGFDYEESSETCLEVEQCQNPTDVLFIMDSFGKARKRVFQKELLFASKVSESFNIGPTETQVGLQLFGRKLRDRFFLNTYTTGVEVKEAILNAPYQRGKTKTYEALQRARTTSLSASNGAREGISKAIVLLTDDTTHLGALALKQATLLKDSGVKIISVGIGKYFNIEELKAIASIDDQVYYVENYDQLVIIQRSLSKGVCKVPGVNEPCTHQCAFNLKCLHVGDEYLCHCPAGFVYNSRGRNCTILEVCHTPVDILLLLDSSGSMGERDFSRELEFATKVIDRFNIGLSDSDSRASVLLFGGKVWDLFSFDSYTTAAEVKQAILAAEFKSGNTFTDLAFKHARATSFTASKGSRSNTQKLAMIVTDGWSTTPERTLSEAQKLKDSGVTVISVGVGEFVHHSELRTMASSRSLKFAVKDFDALVTIEKEVFDSACPAAVIA